jgi:hypothetical protein
MATTCQTCCAHAHSSRNWSAPSALSVPASPWGLRGLWCTLAPAWRLSSPTRSAVSGPIIGRMFQHTAGMTEDGLFAASMCAATLTHTLGFWLVCLKLFQRTSDPGMSYRRFAGACTAACLRTGRWLSCFGRGAKSREAQVLERLKVLDDIVSDSGKLADAITLSEQRDSFRGSVQWPASSAMLLPLELVGHNAVHPQPHGPQHCESISLVVPWITSCASSLQIIVSLCLLGQQPASQQLSVRPLAGCCLLWRRHAASGAGQYSV